MQQTDDALWLSIKPRPQTTTISRTSVNRIGTVFSALHARLQEIQQFGNTELAQVYMGESPTVWLCSGTKQYSIGISSGE